MPRQETIYTNQTQELIQQRGILLQPTEMQSVAFSPDDQLRLLRELRIPIIKSTAGHIFSHYSVHGDMGGVFNIRQYAQGELFTQATLDLFELALAHAKEQGVQINAADMLRSFISDEKGEYDPRFDTPPTPRALKNTFSRFVRMELLTDDQAEEARMVWLEPYPEDVRNQIYGAYREHEIEEIVSMQQWVKDNELLDAAVDLRDVPEDLRGRFLRTHLDRIAVETPERAIEIFYQLNDKEKLSCIDTMVEHLVSTDRAEDAKTLLQSARESIMRMPLREERLARNKRYREEGISKQDKKQADEVTSEDYFALLHPHAFAADLEGMAEIFQRLDGENYSQLCTDLGLTSEQFNALLIQTYVEENPEKKMGQEWDNFRIGKLLKRAYIPGEDSFLSSRDVELYCSVLQRRIIAYGEEGIRYMPEEILRQRSEIEKIIESYMKRGNLEAAKPWIQRYYELSPREELYDPYTLSLLLRSLSEKLSSN
ncbi:MAG TPA: hypothetical protein VJL83_02665 [Patescibacteria group bacterium]|nr:hypothetical protein [Patescibacteria group bacterium]